MTAIAGQRSSGSTLPPLALDLAPEPQIFFQGGDATRRSEIALRVTNVGDRLVLGITATLVGGSQNPSKSVLAPGEPHVFRLSLASFVTFEDPDKRTGMQLVNDRCHIELTSHGILGQRVIQDFVLDLDRFMHGLDEPLLEQVRCQVVSTTGDSTDVDLRSPNEPQVSTGS